MVQKLITITGEELLNTSLPTPRMVVGGLIPLGLHILGGAPKTGKSWFVLWLCLKIAQGEKVWDLLTEKGTVLYLCLEDNLVRLQSRLFDITESAPDNLHFATIAETISGGLVSQIDQFLSEHPDTNFIAIDTLQKVRNAPSDLNAYANDYKDINILKSIADKHHIAILLVHHLRKQGDNDSMNMISGTTGITGAVDGVYILKKNTRKGSVAKFIATGRDVEYREFTLDFDSSTHVWKFISDDSDAPFSLSADNTLSEVISFIKSERNFIGTASQLAEKMKTKTLPNILLKKLTQNQSELSEIGIDLTKSRTGQKREITFTYNAPAHDDNDGNDDKNDSGSVPDLLSQLS